MTLQRILELLASLRPAIRTQWKKAVAAVVSAATIKQIEAHITVGDLAAISAAVTLASPQLTGVLEAIRVAYLTGGQAAEKDARIVFDIRNPAAEQWLRDNSSRLVTNITEEQRGAIRVTLQAGLEQGRNPNQVARDIVGRVGPSGRKGGIVGLTSQQARYVTNLRAELADPGLMAHYFTRQRRDKRFDTAVRRALRNERPVQQATIEKIARRYADRLLALRGETIARTEAMQAFNAARDQAWSQSIEEGNIRAENVIKTWQAAGDKRVRSTHRELDNNRQPKGEPFISISGAMMMFPGDFSLGAPASELANCRCMYSVSGDWLAEAA